ncbi:MAG: zinc ribbon domain-containing protein [Armatimonadetes bacterium]|nr:zinc ribbon domain-containing protein [Armatimonadota bacterium]
MNPSTSTPSSAATPGFPVRCPNCGTVGYEHDNYCACCGTAMANLCRSCGSQIMQPLANYCSKCGAELRRGDDAPQLATPAGVAVLRLV